VQQAALENDAAIQTWSDLADLTRAKASLDRLEKAWRHLFAVLEERLKEKLASPTQVSGDDSIVEAALQDYEEASDASNRAAQVVVLSHDAFFLKSMYDDERSAKTLYIVGRADAHQMKEWNIEEHCSSQAHRDYFLLKTFLTEGVPQGSDLTGVASRVRPYVEDYVRHKYPGEFRGLMTLGDCIKKIRDAPGSDGAGAFKPKLHELEDINEFGRRFMHGGSAIPSAPPEAELEAYARRAIALVQEP
jgi:hypothetical protein